MSSSIFDTPDGEGFKSDKPNVFAKFTPEAQAAAAKQALGGNDKEWRDRRERCWSCKLEDCVSEVAKKYPHSTWEGRKDGSEANQKGGEDHVKPVMDRWHKDEQRVLGAMRRAREEQEARRLAKASMTPEEKAKKDKEREEKKALQAVEREKRKKAAEEKKAKAAVEREKRAKEKAEAKSKAAEHRRKVVEEKRKVAEAKKVATMSQRAQVRRSAKNQSGGPMSTGRAAVPEPATEGDDAGATVLAGLKSAQHGQTVTKTDGEPTSGPVTLPVPGHDSMPTCACSPSAQPLPIVLAGDSVSRDVASARGE
ncbi:hypothetical protein IAU60_004500 [Kwoniella sp. DSM 27419]